MKKTLKTIQFKDVVSQEAFSKTAAAFIRNFEMPLETTDIQARPVRSFCSTDCHPDYCRLVKSSKVGARRCRQDRLKSLNISIETGQPYITICHAGIVLGCVPIMDTDLPLGALSGNSTRQPFKTTLRDACGVCVWIHLISKMR